MTRSYEFLEVTELPILRATLEERELPEPGLPHRRLHPDIRALLPDLLRGAESTYDGHAPYTQEIDLSDPEPEKTSRQETEPTVLTIAGEMAGKLVIAREITSWADMPDQVFKSYTFGITTIRGDRVGVVTLGGLFWGNEVIDAEPTTGPLGVKRRDGFVPNGQARARVEESLKLFRAIREGRVR